MSAKTKPKSAHQGCGTQRVCLAFTHPDAQEVCIAGSFNDWHPGVTPMIRLSDGKWAKELLLAPGRYEYRFVVDGHWVDDPVAQESVPNPFGGMNVVLIVAPETLPTALRRAAKPKASTAFEKLASPDSRRWRSEESERKSYE